MILAVCGNGDLGREIKQLAIEVNGVSCSRWKKIIFTVSNVDDDIVADDEKIFALKNLFTLYKPDEIEFVIGIGEPEVRSKIFDTIMTAGYKFATIIHPTAHIGHGSQIAEGAIIRFNAFVGIDSRVGSNVLIQPFGCLGHDVVIGKHSVISSFVSIAGHCEIGEKTYIGMSVPVKEQTHIGSDTIVGMGSVVTRDISDNVIALGNPARAMQRNDNHKVFK